jgi:hypothetical protein
MDPDFPRCNGPVSINDSLSPGSPDGHRIQSGLPGLAVIIEIFRLHLITIRLDSVIAFAVDIGALRATEYAKNAMNITVSIRAEAPLIKKKGAEEKRNSFYFGP